MNVRNRAAVNADSISPVLAAARETKAVTEALIRPLSMAAANEFRA